MAQSHLDLELSLYLDAALTPEERGRVESHLAGCPSCRTTLEELRAVTRLTASLPAHAPRRSLLPRRPLLPGWLVPARWASAVAAGVFVLAFAVSTVPPSVGFGGSAPAAVPAAAPQASTGAGDARSRLGASPTPGAYFMTTSPQPAKDAAGRATAQPRGDEPNVLVTYLPPERPAPWLWLVPAALFAAIALGLSWRIRQVR